MRLILILLLINLPHFVSAAEYRQIPEGTLRTVLANDATPEPIRIAGFSMRAMPVSNREFLAFLTSNRQWQRERIAALFADKSYLRHWQAPLLPGTAVGLDQPVTNVSWFAAEAYCESEGARLPSWSEWEYVAAADENRRDARDDPAWRARILGWYSHSAAEPLANVGGVENVYGVRDMHGLIWEWVEDFNAILVSVDSRNQGDPDKLQFCGAGAISLQDRDNYAILMRLALLSSLTAAVPPGTLAFRFSRTIAFSGD